MLSGPGGPSPSAYHLLAECPRCVAILSERATRVPKGEWYRALLQPREDAEAHSMIRAISRVAKLLRESTRRAQRASSVVPSSEDPLESSNQRSGPDKGTKEDRESDVLVKNRPKVKRPPLYKVLIHNDDYTTMEFVIHVLKAIFGHSAEKANTIMLKVHKEGTGVCGVYTFEVAETKAEKVTQMAREEGHPLKVSIEAL